MDDKVAIILINLNQEKHTRECIESLQKVTYKPIEVILIDNFSTDGSGERLKTDIPSIIYHRTQENLGFAGGNNVGIKIALDRGADFILLLNNDTVVDPDFIQPLVDYAIKNPDCGFQSCKILFYSQKNVFWYAGGVFKVHKAVGKHRGMFEVDEGQYDEIVEVDFATGCMMFTTRKVIEKVGLLDENLFIYFEDADWSLRVKSHGMRCVYNPKSKIWHKVSVTNKIDSPFYLYLTMRNKILMLQKHSSPSRWLLNLPYFLYFFGRQIFRMIVKWHSLDGTRAVVYGIIDGLRKYTGEYGKGRLKKLVKMQ